MRCLPIGLLALLTGLTCPASAEDIGPANFTVHWERSTTIPEGRGPAAGFQLTGVTVLPDRSLALLAIDPPDQYLFLGTNKDGIGSEVLLPRDGSWPLGINSGAGGDLWLSGFANQWMFVPGDTKRDAYLAKYDTDGNLIWERTYGWWDFRMITRVVPLPSGDLVVAGAHGRDGGWIAKLDQSGSILWEHDMGLRQGVGVAALPDGYLAVTAIEGAGEKSAYREHVTVFVFNANGALVRRTIIREDLNDSSGAHFGSVGMAAVADGIYVITTWTHDSRPRTTEVAKVAPDGTILWKRQLPQTVLDNGTGWKSVCRPSLAALSDGDAIVGCAAASGELLFYRLASATGEATMTTAPLPDCQNGRWHARMSLVPHGDGVVWVIGSLTPFEKSSGCTWLGELSLAE